MSARSRQQLVRRGPGGLVLLGAFALHLTVILRYPSLAWPDEIFQTLEQGHRLAFGFGIRPWEFRDGIRSWFLPGIFGGVMRLTAFLGHGSSGYLLGADLLLAAASVVPVAVTLAWGRREKLPHPWLAGVVCATWFELVFFSEKALTEVFAGYALAPALYFTWSARARADADARAKRRLALLAGACWGLTVGLRIHLAPAAVVAFVWLARTDVARWREPLLGAAAVGTAFGLLDGLTWSYPFQSFVMNVYVNLVERKAASFGVSPPLEYVGSLLETWGWGAVPLLGTSLVAFRRTSLLWITGLTVVISHSAIAHKEYRFLAPLLVLLAMSAGLGLVQVLKRDRAIGWLTAGILLVASADGARRLDWRTLAPRSAGTRSSMWTLRQGALRAYAHLSTRDDVCGVASVGIGWAFTGGYTYLHKDVPIFEIGSPETFGAEGASFNAVLAPSAVPVMGPYIRQQCWGGVCLYVRPGGCAAPGDYTINRWLLERAL